MTFYENIELERNRIQSCINKFGHTSDHNLDWWAMALISPEAAPVFVEWLDGSGILTQKLPEEWCIWSDPLSGESEMVSRIEEFSVSVLEDEKIKKILCFDVADTIYPELKNRGLVKVDDVEYFLLWPVLDMVKYGPDLPRGHFKDIRNARNKFYREHQVVVKDCKDVPKDDLSRIVDDWYKEVVKKQKAEDVFDLKYQLAIKNNFKGFVTARAMLVDNRPVGFNAGYEVVNKSGRFAGIIGLHNYSTKDLGTILWLEDLDWIKNAGYKELDMQGSEPEDLKTKTQFGAVVERKTDTFSITRK